MKSLNALLCLAIARAMALAPTMLQRNIFHSRTQQFRRMPALVELSMARGNTYLESLEQQTMETTKSVLTTDVPRPASKHNSEAPRISTSHDGSSTFINGKIEEKASESKALQPATKESLRNVSTLSDELLKRISMAADYVADKPRDVETIQGTSSGLNISSASSETAVSKTGSSIENIELLSPTSEIEPENEKKNDEDMSEAKKLMQQVKDAGTAGIISYALWELGFWLLSVPVVLFGYVQFTGHFPDLSNQDDVSKLGAGMIVSSIASFFGVLVKK
jgi:hypothetical protein